MQMTRLIPMLPVKSMPASVEFYEKLGFAVEERNDQWRWAMYHLFVRHAPVPAYKRCCAPQFAGVHGVPET